MKREKAALWYFHFDVWPSNNSTKVKIPEIVCKAQVWELFLQTKNYILYERIKFARFLPVENIRYKFFVFYESYTTNFNRCFFFEKRFRERKIEDRIYIKAWEEKIYFVTAGNFSKMTSFEIYSNRSFLSTNGLGWILIGFEEFIRGNLR